MTSHQERLSTARDYEQEAERTRRRLAENLDEFSDRLMPGQVFDEMLTYSRAGGGTFLRAFSNTMRENPVPSLLIGVGCMMFLSEKMGLRPRAWGEGRRPMMATADDPYGASGERSRVSEAAGRVSDTAGRVSEAAGRVSDAPGRMTGSAPASARLAAASAGSSLTSAAEAVSRQTSSAADTVADTMKQTAATVGEAVAGATDAARGTAQDMRDQASGAVEQMRRGAQNVAGTMKETAASVRDAAAEVARGTAASVRETAATMSGRVADTADRTRREAADAVRQGRENAATFISEQPLLCAAIGVAVGAALASMLPSTEAENQLMGEASDAVKGTAGQVGSDALEGAKNVASKAADRAQATMDDREKRVREIAYFIWEQEGRPEGQADRHWQAAREIVDSQDA
jgi:ElaB/YqjD/DUF883 family membrane-anchored ribosome-binding protein